MDWIKNIYHIRVKQSSYVIFMPCSPASFFGSCLSGGHNISQSLKAIRHVVKMTVMMASHWNGVDVYDPLYENVSHLHTLTVGQESEPGLLLKSVSVFWSLPAGVMGQHIFSRQGNVDGVSKRQRESLPPYCNRSTYTTLASFIASFNLSFVLRDTEQINKQVEHPSHNP